MTGLNTTWPFLVNVLTVSPMARSLMGIFFPDLSSTCDLDGKQVDPPDFGTLTFVTQPAEVLENKQMFGKVVISLIIDQSSWKYFFLFAVHVWCTSENQLAGGVTRNSQFLYSGLGTILQFNSIFLFLFFSLLTKLYDTVTILMATWLVCRLYLFLMILSKVIWEFYYPDFHNFYILV